jgi:hypothetical protein
VPAPEKGTGHTSKDEKKEERHLPPYAAGHGALHVKGSVGCVVVWVWAGIDTNDDEEDIGRRLTKPLS